MDRAEAILTIGRRLGNRTDQDDRIATLLDLAQNDLEQGDVIPWFLEKKASLTNEAAALDTIILPTDFIVEKEQSALRELVVGDTVGRPLTKTDLEEIEAQQQIRGTTNTTGLPTHYALIGRNFIIGPDVPATQNTYTFWYFAHDVLPSTLATSGTNLWLTEAPEVIICSAGIKIAAELRDADSMALFTAILHGPDGKSGAMERMRLTHEARQHANHEYRMDSY